MGNAIVIMGVSGSGKSTVGQHLAAAAGGSLIDADDLHPPANVEKMRAGSALTDADRAGWLEAIRDAIIDAASSPAPVFIACSALKRKYRDALREGDPELLFLFLHGPPPLLRERLDARTGHYMPASLLESQLAALEEPGPDENCLSAGIDRPPEDIAKELHRRLRP